MKSFYGYTSYRGPYTRYTPKKIWATSTKDQPTVTPRGVTFSGQNQKIPSDSNFPEKPLNTKKLDDLKTILKIRIFLSLGVKKLS